MVDRNGPILLIGDHSLEHDLEDWKPVSDEIMLCPFEFAAFVLREANPPRYKML